MEFLVIMRDKGGQNTEWGFPTKDQLNTLFEDVRQAVEDNDILEAAIWCSVKTSGIASVLLDTKFFQAMQEFRIGVRKYAGVLAKEFDTYPKATFMKKNMVSMYIPRRFSAWKPERIMRLLFKHYTSLLGDYTIVRTEKYTKDSPSYVSSNRSRIGDFIVYLDGPFIENLRGYEEDFTFLLGADWKISIRGGYRKGTFSTSEGFDGAADSLQFSRNFTNRVVMNTMNEDGSTT